MKKILTMISVFALVANNVNAQLSVYANGYVGVATTSSPTSTLSVKGDKTGYDASIIGTSRGLYSESNGEYLNWAYGVYGKNRSTSAGFQCGTMGD
ncbi:MAG: hypothetical protein K5874_03655, partial [Bacteroidaceae bacterium]|nr:hypothetical protein [Bacteroidaceae bacterium]